MQRRTVSPPPSDDSDEKPALRIIAADLPATVCTVRDLLAAHGGFYERGRELVEVVRGAEGNVFLHAVTRHRITDHVHQHAQPVGFKLSKGGGEWTPCTLPREVAEAYLALGAWNVPPLAGFSTAPLLRDDGSMVTTPGYDEETQVYLDAVATLDVPAQPTIGHARAALKLIRESFETFPFADSPMRKRGTVQVVDLNQDPAGAESCFLAALITAVCRPSLWVAPSVVITAPEGSGSGAGKGKLVRALGVIAFGRQPSPFSPGRSDEEFDKRLAAELMKSAPLVFADNINSRGLRSATLASATTERPSCIRILGKSESRELNGAAMICLTGNGLTVSEDLARRFIPVRIDPRCEDPELRSFDGDILAEIAERRGELLSAALTIWRWGRQHDLKRGMPLGNYETWAEWVRDPLLALGCQDVVAIMQNAKGRDQRRIAMAELFNRWWHHHQDRAVLAAQLDSRVRDLIDPHGGRPNFIVARLIALDGTRAAGFLLTSYKGEGKRSVATYRLEKTDETVGAENRSHPPHAPLATSESYAKDEKRSEYVPGGTGATPHAYHAGGVKRSSQRMNGASVPPSDAGTHDPAAALLARVQQMNGDGRVH